MIRFIALGTSATFPTEKRNHPSFFFEYKGIGFLFDVGENTQRQMRIAKISPKNIDYIFITHWHGDHVLGLPGLLFYLANSEYKKTLRIFLPEENTEDLISIINSFKIPIKFHIEINGIDKDGVVIETEEFLVLAKKVKHNTTCYAYKFIQKDYWKLDNTKIREYRLNKNPKILKLLKKDGYINFNGKEIFIEDVAWLKKGFSFTYITDTLFFDELIQFSEKSDVLLIESTYIQDEELAKEHFHMTFEEAYRVYKNSQSKIMLVTHVSQRYEDDMESIEEYIRSFGDSVFLLHDFDLFNYKKDIIELKISNSVFKFYRDPKTGDIKKIN